MYRKIKHSSRKGSEDKREHLQPLSSLCKSKLLPKNEYEKGQLNQQPQTGLTVTKNQKLSKNSKVDNQGKSISICSDQANLFNSFSPINLIGL